MVRRRRHDSFDDSMDNLIGVAATVLLLGVVGFILKYGQQIIIYGIVAIVVLIAVFIALYFWKGAKKFAALNLDDEKILFMLRGMLPTRFETGNGKHVHCAWLHNRSSGRWGN